MFLNLYGSFDIWWGKLKGKLLNVENEEVWKVIKY